MRPKILAFYLPQYYPIPENDEWWGKGFTEWTNVGRAKPLYKGHYQPKVPSELGYYDLRLPIVREQQAALAKEYGVDGFCYWHYWFGNGKRLLDLVENEVVESGKPDFPFCYCWANHSWSSQNWNARDAKISKRILIKQEYPGIDDYISHFEVCLKAFKDSRYIKIGNKPVFGLFDGSSIPNVSEFVSCWNKMAKDHGFDGIYFFCFCMSPVNYEKVKGLPFDEFVVDSMCLCEKKLSKSRTRLRNYMSFMHLMRLISPRVSEYSQYASLSYNYFKNHPEVTICTLPNYDHSPRSGSKAVILEGSTPERFKLLLKKLKGLLDKRKSNNHFLFVKSWNEWGEGNYLEPDLKYGRGYLEAIRDVFGL